MHKIILCLLAGLPLWCGCAGSQRSLLDAGAGAGAGYLGDKLSGGNAAITTGSAAGGVLLSEGAQAWKTHGEKSAYTNGYYMGRSDGVKQLYWNLQQRQRDKDENPAVQLYNITIPEHYEDGVLVQPETRTVRIQE